MSNRIKRRHSWEKQLLLANLFWTVFKKYSTARNRNQNKSSKKLADSFGRYCSGESRSFCLVGWIMKRQDNTLYSQRSIFPTTTGSALFNLWAFFISLSYIPVLYKFRQVSTSNFALKYVNVLPCYKLVHTAHWVCHPNRRFVYEL